MVSVIRVVLVLLALTGCASIQEADLTPDQQLWAAIAEYNGIAELAADYCESQGAEPDRVNAIKEIDAQAFKLIQYTGKEIYPTTELAEGIGLQTESMKSVLRSTWNEDR